MWQVERQMTVQRREVHFGDGVGLGLDMVQASPHPYPTECMRLPYGRLFLVSEVPLYEPHNLFHVQGHDLGFYIKSCVKGSAAGQGGELYPHDKVCHPSDGYVNLGCKSI